MDKDDGTREFKENFPWKKKENPTLSDVTFRSCFF